MVLVTETTPAKPVVDEETGNKFLGRIRVPLSILFMVVTLALGAALSVTIGVISIVKGNQSIASTSQDLRAMTMNRAYDRVNTMLGTASSLLFTLTNSTMMYKYFNSGTQDEILSRDMLSNMDLLTLHWQMANQNPFIGATGWYMEQNSNYMATYSRANFIAYSDDTTRAVLGSSANWNQTQTRCNDTVRWFDASGNRTLSGSCVMNSMLVRGVKADNSLDFDHAVISRGDWNLTRMWSQPYSSTGKPVWGTITYSTNPVLRTFLVPLIQPIWYGQPVGTATAGQTFFGAQFVTMTLKSLETYIPTIVPTANAILSFMDTTGTLVASSQAGAAASTATGARYKGWNSPNPMVAATAKYMFPQYADDAAYIQAVSNFEDFSGQFEVDGVKYLLDCRWVGDQWGLKWLMIMTIPYADFYGTVDAAKRQIVYACIGLGISGFLIAIATSLIVILPIRRLNIVMGEALNFDFSALRNGYLQRRSAFKEIAEMQSTFALMLAKFATAIQNNKNLGNRKLSEKSSDPGRPAQTTTSNSGSLAGTVSNQYQRPLLTGGRTGMDAVVEGTETSASKF
ncbi:uncharacterized protein SPPG_01257 [Spizellomyces punctatus DAOM BR117]|uniref:HAMP domain-containing protein n=1 Tax=Spizellomyces punctatus (strain DAOM BR117) TaxID=645134 RepID=A0A0L0HSB7_SPIPD|nr:uncharacterized protein SPPG_01257 [Spizellomyces punctatus DAOM BR117]KND03800.1 hypothetical protein SPPG_01257 [Spizellomyces punctatus DAOM BR117]|eukprot:XP_016611839.1 hypothetical protein SPPG_01257 [Spizellomyces punctatus DAOM BR117]